MLILRKENSCKKLNNPYKTNSKEVIFEGNNGLFTIDDFLQNIPIYMINKHGFDIISPDGIFISSNDNLTEIYHTCCLCSSPARAIF